MHLFIVLDRHHIVRLKVRVRDINQGVDVVPGQVDQVPVDSLDVPGAAVAQGECPGAHGALVGFSSGMSLPMTPENFALFKMK